MPKTIAQRTWKVLLLGVLACAPSQPNSPGRTVDPGSSAGAKLEASIPKSGELAEPRAAGEDLDLTIAVDAERVAFLRDGETLLGVSNADQRVFLLGLNPLQQLKSAEFGPDLSGTTFTDVAVVPNGKHVLLVGEDRRGAGVLARLDLESLEFQTIRFESGFRVPSVAASLKGDAFIGDLESRTITVVESELFEGLVGDTTTREEFDRNIYLEQASAAEVGVSTNGEFILASDATGGQISLIDTWISEVVDTIGPGAGHSDPLTMVVAPPAPDTAAAETFVAIVGAWEDLLLVARIDRQFQSFDKVASASLGLGAAPQGGPSPVLVSAGDGLETIVVGHQGSRKAVVFRRVGRTLERRDMVTLKRRPDEIVVSPNGRMIAFLNIEAGALRVIDNPVEWFDRIGKRSGSPRVREAQKSLSALHYPVGVVDGIDGPSTRRAVRAFQMSAGLPVTGTVDRATVKEIQEVASELPEDDTEGTTGSGRECRQLGSDEHCRERLGFADFSTSYGSNQTKEVSCEAPATAPRPIQVDSYSLSPVDSGYRCTSYHSCPFIRFRDVVAYHDFCR